MNAKEFLTAVLEHANSNWSGAASKLGWARQSMSRKINTGSLRADDFLALLDAMDVNITVSDRKTGEVIVMSNAPTQVSIKSVIDGVLYEVDKSAKISEDNTADEEFSKHELYVDSKGRYFMVHYCADLKKSPIVTTVSDEAAVKFIVKHGAA